MAARIRNIAKGAAVCHRQLVATSGQSFINVSQPVTRHLPVRAFAAKRTQKDEKQTKVVKHGKDKEEKSEKVIRKIDNTNRHKPYGFTAWVPVDDVYLVKYYPRPVHNVGAAVDMLKTFQQLDYSSPQQNVFIDLKLDMKLEKKKKVDSFVSTVELPYAVQTEDNKIVVFTENASQAEVAQANGATYVGGVELIDQILEDKITADFYIAVPEMISKLVPLKNKLRKKFPKNTRGTVGTNIPKMLEKFRRGHEYLVDNECYVVTRIATLDMPKEHIVANIESIITDVCSHKPASFGPFIERAILSSASSEGLLFDSKPFAPAVEEDKQMKVAL